MSSLSVRLLEVSVVSDSVSNLLCPLVNEDAQVIPKKVNSRS